MMADTMEYIEEHKQMPDQELDNSDPEHKKIQTLIEELRKDWMDMYENNNSTGNYSGGQKVNTDTYQQNYDYGSSYNGSYGSNYGGSYNSGYNSYNSYRREPEKKKTSFAVKALTFALCGTLFGTFAGAGFYDNCCK